MGLWFQKLVNWSLPFWLHCLQAYEYMAGQTAKIPAERTPWCGGL